MFDYFARVRSFSPNARLYLLNTVLLGLAFGLQFLFFNLYVLSLGYDQAFVGTLAGLPALVTAVSAIPIGLFLPRLGFRRSLFAGSVFLVLSLLVWSFLPGRSNREDPHGRFHSSGLDPLPRVDGLLPFIQRFCTRLPRPNGSDEHERFGLRGPLEGDRPAGAPSTHFELDDPGVERRSRPRRR